MKKLILLGAFITVCSVTSTFAQSSATRTDGAVITEPVPAAEMKETVKPAKAASCCSKKSSASSCSSAKAEAVKSCSGGEAKAAGKSSCCQKGGHGHADAKVEESSGVKQNH